RATLILLLCCFPCCAVLINIEQLLLLMRQDPEVSRLTQRYVMAFVPALPTLAPLSQSLCEGTIAPISSSFQMIMWPLVLSGVVGNVVNVIANCIFLYVLHLGITGSAWANTVAQYSQTIFLFLYIIGKKLHVKTWGGWSSECLLEWDSFTSLAIPSMLMMCIEWWTYEIGSFLIGLLSVIELSAQSIIYEVSVVAFMIPLGLATAASVQVGNALGAGDVETAKRSSSTSLLCTGQATHLFSVPREIVELVAWVMPVYVVFHLFEAMCGACSGVLRGIGKQKFGAILNAVSYYGVGLPLGAVLLFVARIGVIGLWLSMLVCVSILCTCFIAYISRMDWRKAAEEVTRAPTASHPASGKLPQPCSPEHHLVPQQLWDFHQPASLISGIFQLHSAISSRTNPTRGHTMALLGGDFPHRVPLAKPVVFPLSGSAPRRSDPATAGGAKRRPRTLLQGASLWCGSSPTSPHLPPRHSGAGVCRYGQEQGTVGWGSWALSAGVRLGSARVPKDSHKP
uniref:Multidrug and toxin extrusion protein n=1 Tax=Strix occidentalis caurina TaxID=311401 RepID=A0A8D0KVF9_STROC